MTSVDVNSMNQTVDYLFRVCHQSH